MADSDNTSGEEGGLNRRTFLKSAGFVVAGGTLGAGLTTLPRKPLRLPPLRRPRRRRSPISAARSARRISQPTVN